MQIPGLFVTLGDNPNIIIIPGALSALKKKSTWEEEIKRQKKVRYSKVRSARAVLQSPPRNRRLPPSLLLHLPRLLPLHLHLPPLPKANSRFRW
jgi:hypothetical protein